MIDEDVGGGLTRILGGLTMLGVIDEDVGVIDKGVMVN